MVHTVNQLPYNTNKTKLHLQLDPVDSPGSVRDMRFAGCPPEGASKKSKRCRTVKRKTKKKVPEAFLICVAVILAETTGKMLLSYRNVPSCIFKLCTIAVSHATSMLEGKRLAKVVLLSSVS